MNLESGRSRRTALVLLCATVSVAPVVLGGTLQAAQALPGASAETTVSTTTADLQYQPDVATDATGNYVVVWTSEGQDGSGSGVYLQRFHAGGVPAGTETRVNTTAAGFQSEPSVAMDSDGDFVVAWTSDEQDGDNTGVYLQRYDSAGTRQGVETQVNTETVNYQYRPSVAMDSDGDFVVVWGSGFQDGDGSGVYAQRFAADGTPRGTETLVNTTTAAHQDEPSVAMDADGDYVVTWTDESGQDGSFSGVYSQRYGAGGTARGPETRVNTNITFDQRYSSVAMGADGGYTVAWTSYSGDGSGLGIFAQRYLPTGAPDGSEIQVNTTAAGTQQEPSVARDADGDSVIAWVDYAADGDGLGIFAQRYLPTGAPHGGETQLNTSIANYQSEVSGAMDADGDYVASWTSTHVSFLDPDVMSRRWRGPASVDLALTQADNADPVAAGGRLVYRLRVGNRTPESEVLDVPALDAALGAASGVRVVVTRPTGATFQSASGAGWACGTPGPTMTCRLATPVLAGDSAPDLRLTYTAPGDAGPALQSVRVAATHPDPVSTNNTEVERTSVMCALGFSAANFANTESGSITATVTRTGTDCGSSGVSYNTATSTATPGVDYTNVAGTLTWADGETSKTFTVPLVDDGVDEATEQLNLLLSSPTDALLGTRSLATGQINDNDDPPRINFSTTASSASEPGALVRLTVELSEISGQQVTVVLAKAGTATYLTDYFAPKRITIPAGQTSAAFTVEVADDEDTEASELAVIALATPTGATLGSQKTYRLTITDDD